MIPLAVLSMGMGSWQAPGDGELTLEALFVRCHLPGECDRPVACEGQTVRISAFVDPVNIYDRRHYPQLPYEKFRLHDGHGRSVEVWPQAGDNRDIFKKIAMRPSDQVTVEGRLARINLPRANRCRTSVKVIIEHADQIQFKTSP